MTDWSNFHADTKRGRVFRCKVCDLLAKLPDEAAKGLRAALSDAEVTDNAIERALRSRGEWIGRTAIRTHRQGEHA